jgi:dCTP deaminase
MILSYLDIKKSIEKKQIVIDPFNSRFFKEASYILHLGRKQIHVNKIKNQINISDSNCINNVFSKKIDSDKLILKPGNFVLVNTLEKITMPLSYAGFITPLSHISRWGIDTTQSSTLISPGFGRSKPTSITLEFASHNPNELLIPVGTPICNLIFITLKSRVHPKNRVKSLYEGISSPSLSRLAEEFNKLEYRKDSY